MVCAVHHLKLVPSYGEFSSVSYVHHGMHFSHCGYSAIEERSDI